MTKQRINGPGPGLITRVIAAVVGAVVLVGLFFAGLVAWVLLAGVLLVGGVVMSIWLWRERRRFDRFRRQQDSRFIEVEYEVLDERESPPD